MQDKISKVNEKRWIILLTTVLLTFMTTLDSSIVNVALPVMSEKLSVSMAATGWVVTSYLIVIVGTILIFGRLGDTIGKSKIFKIGIVIFTLGSLFCGISSNLGVLVIGRVIQAVGAAGVMATNQGIITNVFPANERGRALGLNGTFVALGAMVGPPLGGVIVAALKWEYIFLINVPIGIIAFILAMNTLPKNDEVTKEPLDVCGAILFAVSVIALFGAVVQGQEIGYNNKFIIGAFILAVVAFIAFIYAEKKSSMPLLQLDIFKNKLFSLSIICGFIAFVAIGSSNIIMPYFLQYVRALSPSVTGLLLMVSPMILAVVAPLSGYVSDKVGAESLTFVGLILTSAGLALIGTSTQTSPIIFLLLFIALMTLGNGMFQSPNNSLVMSTVPNNKLGIAGSINALVRNLGMVFGISLSTTLLYNRMSSKIGYHVTNYVNGRADIFLYGMKWVYFSAAVICALGAALTAYRIFGFKGKKTK